MRSLKTTLILHATIGAMAAWTCGLFIPTAGAAESHSFEGNVAAILIRHCICCHGSDDPKGGLDLTNAGALLKGSDSGVVVAAGDPDASYLIERVTERSMPPKDKGTLTEVEIAALTDWVRNGAHWPDGRVLNAFELTTDKRAGYDWWSLQPVTSPAPPAVQRTEWVQNPIDAFVIHSLEHNELSPSEAEDRQTLLRRAYFDLTGLPPTPTDIDEFLADTSGDAYEHLLDRLLDSPHYGERWARHWLDVVRFGESDGFEEDQFREHAWRYRDYVINSLNADKPYLQFIREQLAGDVIQPVTQEGMIATGFLVAGPWDFAQKVSRSETEKLRAREAQLEELVGVVSQTFMGLTVNCARCHDHKFDVISQEDYYRVKAVFDGVDHSHTRDHEERPLVVGPVPASAGAGNDKDSEVPRAYWGVRFQPPPTRLYLRGDIAQPGPTVVAGGLSAFREPSPELGLAAGSPEGERRRRFAEWLTDPRHPLTARVMVNRVWQHHFGRPLVENPSDFGFNGGRPSHPELLDWLSTWFARNGYRLKPLHRLIMLSATYRQSSQSQSNAAEFDANNRWLWHYEPHRLEGEVVRDAMLAVSNQLNRQVGGPSFRPFEVTRFNTYFYHLIDEDRPEFHRRTLYRMSINTGRDPLLDALDCPAPSLTIPSRRHTTTAQQALSLMNSPLVVRQSAALSLYIASAAGQNPEDQVRLGYRLAFGRPPLAEELAEAKTLIAGHGLESFCWTLFNASEFLYVR